jgi:hypothetical protein
VKVGDMVRQVQAKSTVPVGALGIIVEEVAQSDLSRYTILWTSGNKRDEDNIVTETVSYGYGCEVISECR